MTTSVDYEVQIYERGDWQIASMSNDKDQALREARRIEEGLKRRETESSRNGMMRTRAGHAVRSSIRPPR